MKKIILFAFFITILVKSNAQTNVIPYAKMGLSNYVSSTFKGNMIQDVNNDYDLRFSYGLGLDFSRKINETMSFNFGIGFQDMGSKSIRLTYLGTIEDITAYQIRTYHQYINLPVALQINMVQNEQLTSFFSFGGNVNINVDNYAVTTFYEEYTRYSVQKIALEDTPDRFYPNLGLAVKADLGLQYLLEENLFLRIAASGDFSLLPTIRGSTLNQRHYNLCLNVGLGFML